MSVEIVVNWNFRSGGDEAHVSYRTGSVQADRPDERKGDKPAQSVTRVVPLGSSVLAPGLSMPIPAR
jgi:hypothetical protein